MAVDFAQLLADLDDETTHLDELLNGLGEELQWDRATLADGWAIRDQISHLAYFDDAACLALTDGPAFERLAQNLRAQGPNFPDLIAERERSRTASNLHNWFTTSRARLLSILAVDDPRRRIPWFGPPMSVASAATARLMETWAHGQDIYDTFNVAHPSSPGLKSIAHLGVTTFGWAFQLNDLPVPSEPMRIELSAPDSDECWHWGPADAANRVSGPALDFVLAVTQRRHWTDTALAVAGPVAVQWMSIAQAYAGERGPGRNPGATAS
jgi:uncharacterized protein (TIGR03084 family)